MKNSLPNIAFENLNPDLLRSLCARAIESMNTHEGADPDLKPVLDMDLRIPAVIRLNTTHGSSAMWSAYRSSVPAVMTLLQMFVQMKNERPGRYMYLEADDVSKEAALHPDVVSFLMENRTVLGVEARLASTHPFFFRVTGPDVYGAFKENPALMGSLGAMFNGLGCIIENTITSTILRHEKMEYHRTVLGFLHKWNNDTPNFLRQLWSVKDNAPAGNMSEGEFDTLMLQLCNLCRKDNENMKRIKADLSNDSVGGKAGRRREAGWLTVYMNRLVDTDRICLAKEIVSLVPPMMSLVPSKVRSSKHFRSLKRLYQISGDYE